MVNPLEISKRPRFLFIKLRHIGDSLLLTPTLVATKAKYPDAEIWVLVRKSCDGILAGCPEIDRILLTANPDSSQRNGSDLANDFHVASTLIGTHFDYVFELTDNDRARFFSICARTKNRCTNDHRSLRWFWKPFFHHICTTKRYPKHQVIRDFTCPREILHLPEDPPPLRFAFEKMQPFPLPLEPNTYAVVHCHTRWERKSWPLDRWRQLISGILEFTPAVIVSCGPAPEEIESAHALTSQFSGKVYATEGRANWAQLAGLLHSASYFVGVDTAAMHLAAACGCPTVCLFGPSPVFEYHPWKVKHWMIRPHDWLGEETAKKIPRDEIMKEIPVASVLEACREAAKLKGL